MTSAANVASGDAKAKEAALLAQFRAPAQPRGGGVSEARLSTRLWVQAMIRCCSVDGLTAVLVRRGDEDCGAVMLKVNRFDSGYTVWTQTRTMDGAPAWMRGTGSDPVADAIADAYVERQVRRDPDLWVVEIEDRHARYMPDGKVI